MSEHPNDWLMICKSLLMSVLMDSVWRGVEVRKWRYAHGWVRIRHYSAESLTPFCERQAGGIINL